MADYTWKTDAPGVIGHNFNRWNQTKNQTDFYLPCQSIEEIGFVFIYLCDSSGKRVSFAKFPAAKFADHNAKLLWIEFTPDPVLKEIQSPELAGLCSFRLSIAKGTKDTIKFGNQPEWNKKFRRPDTNLIRAYIYQARDLPAADEDGSSDPLIRIFDHWSKTDSRTKPRETKYIDNTLFPMYYECIELNIEGKPEDLPPFVVDVYDVDTHLLKSDEKQFMCRSIINLQDAAVKIINNDSDDIGKPPTPKWHKCYFKQGQQSCGEVLLSFVISPEFDRKWKVSLPNIKMMGVLNKAADTNALV